MKKKIKIVLIAGLSLFVGIGIAACLFYNGILLVNNPSTKTYPVRGVDVSSWQGEINWKIIKGQNIKFAFIKATEGSSFIDTYFHSNWDNAVKAGLRIGAYHFFSYDSGGAAQAEHFISQVPKMENMLPPVIDVEFYGDKAKNPPKKADVKPELEAFIKKIEEAYGMAPILYATNESYKLYIKGEFSQCDIWIRNVFYKPSLLPGKRKWTFWQYTNRGRLKGYKGKEKYIDINVFNGTALEFENYAKEA